MHVSATADVYIQQAGGSSHSLKVESFLPEEAKAAADEAAKALRPSAMALACVRQGQQQRERTFAE
jgi:hypothetical protein